MTLPQLLILGVVIGANNLATALALGALGQKKRRLRLVATFGVFEFLIPLVGLWVGIQASTWFVDHTHWVSVVLLVGLGLFSLLAAFHKQSSDGREEKLADRLTSPLGTMMLAAGMSLDNLVVGFSLGLRDARPLVVAATIAIFSMTFAWIGITLGDRGRRHWEHWIEGFAGILLIALGIAAGFGWL